MKEIFDTIITNFAQLQWVEVSAVVTGLAYVILAARNHVACWSVGIISSSLWAYASFFYYSLQIDAILQIIYVFMGIWGWYNWIYGGNKKQDSSEILDTPNQPDDIVLKVSTKNLFWHSNALVGGAIVSIWVGYMFASYTSAAATYWDAGTTVFSLIATYLTILRTKESWLYWFVIDIVYVFLYGGRGGYLFALLFIIYVFMSLAGYYKWNKIYKQQIATT